MIDERHLADPDRCPGCAARLTGVRDACPMCALPLLGPTASRLWQVSVEASRVLGERARLVAALRAQGPAHGYAATPAALVPPAPMPAMPVPAAPEWTPRRVQNLLLVLGVALLGVAAVIFLVVSWGRLGVGGRAAVMTGVTAIAAAGAWRADRRGLSATAEALSLLAVGLALLDCVGAWASDLAGLRSVDGSLVAAGSAALVATLAGASSHVLRTRSLRLSAAVLGQLPVPLVAGHAAGSAAQPAALLAAAAAAQAVAAVAVTTGWVGRDDTRDARRVVGVGAGLAGAAATGLSLVAAYAESGSLVVGTALLVVVALSAAVAGELVRGRTGVVGGFAPGTLLQAAAAAILVAAVWAPVLDLADDQWVAPQMSAAALVLLGLAVLVPAGRRAAPAGVLLAASWLPAAAAGPALAAAVVGRLQWLEQPWRAAGGPARALLEADYIGPGWPVAGTGPDLVLLLTVAVAASVAPLVHRSLRPAAMVAAPAGAAAGLLTVTALDGPYGASLGVDLFVALLGTVGGAWLLRREARAAGTSAMVSGAVVLALTVAWSFAVESATLAVLPAAAAVLTAAVGAARGMRGLRGLRVGGAVAAVLLMATEGAAVARASGAGWPAVWVVALSLLVVSLAAATAAITAGGVTGDMFWARVRRATAVVAATATLALTGAVTWWQGAGPAGVGLAVTVAAAMLVSASTIDIPDRVLPSTMDLRHVALAGGLVGLLAAGSDGDRLWLALLALGVGAAVLALRVDHRAGWLSGVLLAASSWVRLSLSDVTAPEAYTIAPAVALLVVGWRRRVSDPTYRSWTAYAPGLLLGLGPSLLRAVTDAGDLRPLVLGLAALAVLAVGVWARLQAPLVIGAGVLAVDAVVQLAPYLVAVYDVVPRWLTIGAVGLLLLGAGATYEQRVRDLRRVGRRVKALA